MNNAEKIKKLEREISFLKRKLQLMKTNYEQEITHLRRRNADLSNDNNWLQDNPQLPF